MNKWAAPDSDHTVMVDLIKDRIETQGFCQIVEGDTRFWPHTPSSLIDHIWNNCPARIIHSRNINLALSDHNLLEIKIRLNGSDNKPKVFIARDRSKLDTKQYQELVSKIDWTKLYNSEDINVANDIFEEEIRGILDTLPPVKIKQVKKSNKSWISRETRDKMTLRD